MYLKNQLMTLIWWKNKVESQDTTFKEKRFIFGEGPEAPASTEEMDNERQLKEQAREFLFGINEDIFSNIGPESYHDFMLSFGKEYQKYVDERPELIGPISADDNFEATFLNLQRAHITQEVKKSRIKTLNLAKSDVEPLKNLLIKNLKDLWNKFHTFTKLVNERGENYIETLAAIKHSELSLTKDGKIEPVSLMEYLRTRTLEEIKKDFEAIPVSEETARSNQREELKDKEAELEKALQVETNEADFPIIDDTSDYEASLKIDVAAVARSMVKDKLEEANNLSVAKLATYLQTKPEEITKLLKENKEAVEIAGIDPKQLTELIKNCQALGLDKEPSFVKSLFILIKSFLTKNIDKEITVSDDKDNNPDVLLNIQIWKLDGKIEKVSDELTSVAKEFNTKYLPRVITLTAELAKHQKYTPVQILQNIKTTPEIVSEGSINPAALAKYLATNTTEQITEHINKSVELIELRKEKLKTVQDNLGNTGPDIIRTLNQNGFQFPQNKFKGNELKTFLEEHLSAEVLGNKDASEMLIQYYLEEYPELTDDEYYQFKENGEEIIQVAEEAKVIEQEQAEFEEEVKKEKKKQQESKKEGENKNKLNQIIDYFKLGKDSLIGKALIALGNMGIMKELINFVHKTLGLKLEEYEPDKEKKEELPEYVKETFKILETLGFDESEFEDLTDNSEFLDLIKDKKTDDLTKLFKENFNTYDNSSSNIVENLKTKKTNSEINKDLQEAQDKLKKPENKAVEKINQLLKENKITLDDTDPIKLFNKAFDALSGIIPELKDREKYTLNKKEHKALFANLILSTEIKKEEPKKEEEPN